MRLYRPQIGDQPGAGRLPAKLDACADAGSDEIHTGEHREPATMRSAEVLKPIAAGLMLAEPERAGRVLLGLPARRHA